MKATVSEKGQVTIPKKLRERLGVKAGDVLEFEEEAGRLVARKALPVDPIEAVRGILDDPRPVDELMIELRGELDGLGPT
jgi:looped-hinge helix DNA binding domain, AbrB family